MKKIKGADRLVGKRHHNDKIIAAAQPRRVRRQKVRQDIKASHTVVQLRAAVLEMLKLIRRA